VETSVNADEVGFTKAVYDNLKNKEGFHAAFVGERTLKNVPNPVGLYVLVDESTAASETV
jgi:class 3 adenylate cyclase